ncbi:F-box/FBD/LRR-repeat protein At1g16930-like [Vicia villosa]|uniref:F-box/FBD/LRR-repeat protein At1g16930-like n=1 Tax=Vicia villosa TaxID=3911 RepID=UPI00273C036C|nr:F-box/FBD/LRR-repeat protein At1g16930-like [Vicia villosa]
MASDTMMKKTKHIENKDRISDLPDSVLLHILSFLKTTPYTVQTCILSKRWKNLWKKFHVLYLDSEWFDTLEVFTQFISQLLSRHDQGMALHAFKLYMSGQHIIEPDLFESILKYVVSYNVKHLRVWLKCDIQHFPSSLLSCHTLTSLYFHVTPSHYNKQKILFSNSLNLPSLSNLDIGAVAFLGGTEPFSACPKLIRLRISNFSILGEQNLLISSTTLVKLTIQLYCKSENDNTIELSTPSLRIFAFIGIPNKILYGIHLSSVEHVEIDAYTWNRPKAPSILLSWLLKLANIKILTVSSNTLQVLSLVPDLLKVKLHSLCNLKRLNIKKKRLEYGLYKALVRSKLAQVPATSQKEVAKLREAYKQRSTFIPKGTVRFLYQNTASVEVYGYSERKRIVRLK